MTVSDDAAKKETGGRSNLTVRLLSGLVLGPLVLLLVFIGGWPFIGLVLVLAVVSLLEFYEMGRTRGIQGNNIAGLIALLAFLFLYLTGQYLWLPLVFLAAGIAVYVIEMLRGSATRWGRVAVTLAGLAYAGFPPAFLGVIRAAPDAVFWMLFIIFITWGTDTFAYFGGRFWGKRPLAPRISPKKTIEGAVVGLVLGFLLGVVVLALYGKVSAGTIVLALLGPPIAVIGDLFESQLKRFFGVKDSHLSWLNLIPGHGGVLDRTDSLIWVTTLCYLYLLLGGML
jgi:phosphatidate cytidylyltransferase